MQFLELKNCIKNKMKNRIYDVIEDGLCDVISDSQVPMFTYEPQTSREDLKMLSLFSGCGGMDIGFLDRCCRKGV